MEETMRRRLGLVLAVLALGVGPLPGVGHAQGSSNIQDLLAAACLTEADVPQGLSLEPARSGSRTVEQGRPSHQVTFMANGRGDRSLMGVINVVEQYPDAATGVDQLTERFRSGLGGSLTDLPAPAVGEASRAFTSSRQLLPGAPAATTAFVAIRRGNLVASVAVASMGEGPQTELALRLAQDLDRRLTAVLSPGT
jgi:hypothetical protein